MNRGLPFWPLIVILIVVFLIWAEYGSQDCLHDAINSFKPIDEQDGVGEISDKLIDSFQRQYSLVIWRRAMLVSIVSSTIISLIYFKRHINGFNFFMICFYIMITVYGFETLNLWYHKRPKYIAMEKVLTNRLT